MSIPLFPLTTYSAHPTHPSLLISYTTYPVTLHFTYPTPSSHYQYLPLDSSYTVLTLFIMPHIPRIPALKWAALPFAVAASIISSQAILLRSQLSLSLRPSPTLQAHVSSDTKQPTVISHLTHRLLSSSCIFNSFQLQTSFT